ncbi:hypothetical protein T484DRAFT_1958723, partial [Baffinella frigidus]
MERNAVVSTAAGAAHPLHLIEVVVNRRNRTRQAVRTAHTAHLLSAPPTSHKQPLTGYAWDPSTITPV